MSHRSQGYTCLDLTAAELYIALPANLRDEILPASSTTTSAAYFSPRASNQASQTAPAHHHSMHIETAPYLPIFNGRRSPPASLGYPMDPMLAASPVTPSASPSKDDTELHAGSKGLIKRIRALPKDLQHCFSEWRRERKIAIEIGDVERQRAVEHTMWRALRSLP